MNLQKPVARNTLIIFGQQLQLSYGTVLAAKQALARVRSGAQIVPTHLKGRKCISQREYEQSPIVL